MRRRRNAHLTRYATAATDEVVSEEVRERVFARCSNEEMQLSRTRFFFTRAGQRYAEAADGVCENEVGSF
jgi:hypothetical protein